MRRLFAILALLAAPAWAIPPQADDFWAAAASSASGGLSDELIAHANCKAYWHASYGVALSGTNVAAWVDQKSGITAAATNASTTPWYDAAAYGGKGAVLFNGAQAFNLDAVLSATNSSTIMVGFKATDPANVTALSRYDSDGGPNQSAGNAQLYFHPDANDTGVNGKLSGSTISNTFIIGFTHDGGNVTTNNTRIFQGGTNLVGKSGVTTYYQPGPGPAYNRIGGRRNGFSTGRILAVIHFQPQITDSEMSNFCTTVRTEWGF